MVVYYDPHYPAYTSLAVSKGTVLHAVVLSGEFWCHSSLHAFLAIWFYNKRDDYHLDNFQVPSDAFKLTLTLNTFLLVYFSSQCYARYWAIYDNTQAIDMALKLFVRQLDTFLWQKSVRRNVKVAIKYLLAAIFLFYFVLSDGGRIDEEEWDFMRERGLLTSEEIKYLRSPRSAAIKGVVLTSWAVRCVQDAMRTDELMKLFSPPERGAFVNRVDMEAIAVNSSMRNISDLLALPVPFAYFHLLSLVMVMNFCIASWYLVVNFYTPWTIVPFSMTVLVCLGIRSLSAAFADPFQPESRDRLQCAMPSLAFLNNAYHNAVALVETIEDHHPHPEPRCEADDMFMDSEQTLAKAHHGQSPFKAGQTIAALQKGLGMHHRCCVGEQAHVPFQWKSSQVGGSFVEGWIKAIRHKIFHEYEDKEIQKPDGAAPAAAQAAAPKLAEPAELTPEQMQMMGAIQKLADQQRALCAVVNRLINNEQEYDSGSNDVTEPLLGDATSVHSAPTVTGSTTGFTSVATATPSSKETSSEKPAASKAKAKAAPKFGHAKTQAKPAAKKFGKPMPPAG